MKPVTATPGMDKLNYKYNLDHNVCNRNPPTHPFKYKIKTFNFIIKCAKTKPLFLSNNEKAISVSIFK